MDLLQELLTAIPDDERKRFKKFIGHKSSAENRKDLMIMELLCGDEKLDAEGIIKKVYSSASEGVVSREKRNAYYQMRLKLSERAESFIIQQSQKDEPQFLTMHFLTIGKFLIKRKKYQAAWHYFQKAESIAKELEQYELLNLVYYIQIENSWTEFAEDIEVLVSKREENLRLAKEDGNLNTALSLVRSAIRDAYVKGVAVDVHAIAERILKSFGISNEVSEKPAFIYKMAMIVVLGLRDKRNFKAIEDYLSKVYAQMEQGNMFDKYNHSHRLELLTLLSLSSFKNKKFSQCEIYLRRLKEEEGRHGETYPVNTVATMITIDLFICTGRVDEALQVLKDFERKYEGGLTAEDKAFRTVNFIALYFIKQDYQKAISYLSKLPVKESQLLKLPSFGIKGLLYYHLTECLIHFEKEDYEYVGYKLHNTERKFASLLNDPLYKREKTFMNLLRQLAKNSGLSNNDAFRAEAERFISLKPMEVGSVEFISFNAWLLSKLQGKTYYEAYLEMSRPE